MWTGELTQVAEALKTRGYDVQVCTRAEAVARVSGFFAEAGNVGWGGSESVKELGLRDLAAEMGKEIRDHRLDCDLFLLSANALLTDGRIVNIDGTGNRIAASIYGPRRVVYVIGRNKIVDGGLDDAIERIKTEACPPNCRRLGKQTPCALNGRCADARGAGCDSPDRICKATVIFDRPPTRTPTTVLLVDACLGY